MYRLLISDKTKSYKACGAVMPEDAAVPDAVLQKTAEMKKYLAISYEYANCLKPKATKKAKEGRVGRDGVN